MPTTSEGGRSSGASAPRWITGDASSLHVAREMVADALADAAPEVRDTSVLLAGELVTNALVHGGGRFHLRVDADRELVRVEVTDTATSPPRLLPPDGSREHGRGMAIVDALASAWGAGRRGAQKVVWFELRCTPPA